MQHDDKTKKDEKKSMTRRNEGLARKLAAGLLAGLGILGLGVAAASQLNMAWAGNFQAGNVTIDADCQVENQAVNVNFDKPEFVATVHDSELPWGVANVNFTNVSGECNAKSYEAAYKTDGTWTELSNGTVNGTSIAVPLGTVDPQTIDEVALTIYSE